MIFSTKDLLKSLKLEGHFERKLEKLEHKTKKIKEKKFALFGKSSDSEAGPSSSKSHSRKDEEIEELRKMDAAPVLSQNIIPHMLGGEVYLHQWRVVNTGKLPWTSEVRVNCNICPQGYHLGPLKFAVSVNVICYTYNFYSPDTLNLNIIKKRQTILYFYVVIL